MDYTIGEQYLTECGGDVRKYHAALRSGTQRVGQAFYNALSVDDQNRLRGTLADPFNKQNGNQAVFDAVEFLTRP